jgi:hypothetical protein
MIINILKDSSLYKNLEKYNSVIRQISSKYTFKHGPDPSKGEATEWFDPDKYREAPLSRTYPRIAPEQWKKEYCLIFYLPNYVPLFLINTLYQDRKDVLFEDFGAGAGRLFFYLSKLGFTNFHDIDNFDMLPKSFFEEMMTAGDIKYHLNDLSLQPVIVHNASTPFYYVTHGLDKEGIFKSASTHKPNPYIDVEWAEKHRNLTELELICFYTNREWEELAYKILEPQGYRFLCRDGDDMGVAWCREDKYKEFKERLEPYER